MHREAQWRAALRFAAGVYRIAPAAFWRLSLVEWRALTREPSAALSRADLDRLSAIFPDKE